MDHVGGETHDGEGNRIRRDERPSMDRAALVARDSSEESLQEDLYITIGNFLMVSFSGPFRASFSSASMPLFTTKALFSKLFRALHEYAHNILDFIIF